MTYLWAALAGGGLTASCLALQGREVTWLPLAAAVLFVISMHLMNRIMERSGAMQFNTPEMAAFYATHRSALTALGVLSCLGALIAGWWLGTVSFLLLCGMIGAGLLYTVPLGPDIWRSRRKWTSLKDIPGSKTPLVALGWAMAAAVLPVVGSEHTLNVSGVAVSFIFAAGMVFWRTALSDLLDIQGDRIVGRETIPILIGPNRCERLLVWLLVFLSVLIVASSWIGWTTAAGYWLVVNTVGYGICYRIYRGRHFVDRLSFDGMLDGNLLLAGMICIVYGAM
jgi:4-hydroxy-3-methylbut-2-enyl diphosphate reductase